MNVMVALFVPKIQNALILLVNISVSAIQDWIYVKLNGCIDSEISWKYPFLSKTRFNDEREVLY